MVQEATRRETLRVAYGTGIGVILMILGFALLHRFVPEQVPFDFRVILGGILGGCVGVLNFFLMGLTVQKVAAQTDEKLAYQYMKASYSRRILLQVVWIILCFMLPFVNAAAGIIPLFLPSAVVKIFYIFLNKESSGKTVLREGDEPGSGAGTAESSGQIVLREGAEPVFGTDMAESSGKTILREGDEPGSGTGTAEFSGQIVLREGEEPVFGTDMAETSGGTILREGEEPGSGTETAESSGQIVLREGDEQDFGTDMAGPPGKQISPGEACVRGAGISSPDASALSGGYGEEEAEGPASTEAAEKRGEETEWN